MIMEEGFPYDDAHFEAMRGRLQVEEPKDLVCQSKKKITRMCIKPSCTNTSLLCNQMECPSCLEEHRKCPVISLEVVTEGINKHYPTKKYITEQVGAIEEKFFNSLRESSALLGEEMRLAGLGERERRVAEEIYDKGNARCLKGNEAAEFYQAVEEHEEHRPSTETIQNLLDQYDQALQKALATAA